MKKHMLLFSIFAFASVSAQKIATYRCYNDSACRIKVQLKFYAYTAASVKYAGQKMAIPLDYVSGSDRAESIFYNEKYNGKVTGSYEIQYHEDGEFLLYHPKKEAKTYTYSLNEEKSFLPNSDEFRTTPCF